ncbi:hypothetical protein ERY430_50141 [Erythrobacter sp. EC-HK427]|nr:hypothetical protein ERY430_50141 [Erythrobacter sp. EC-HK427]
MPAAACQGAGLRLRRSCGGLSCFCDLHDVVHENSRCDHGFRIERSERINLFHLNYGGLTSHGHDRAKISCCLAVDEVPPTIGPVGLHERQIGMNRIFQDIVAPVDFAGFLALGQLGPEAGWREYGPKARARRLDACGEITLRNKLQLQFAGAIAFLEMAGPDHARVGADNLAHSARTNQGSDANIAGARVIADDGQVGSALRHNAFNQFCGHAGLAEAADHNGGSILQTRQGLRDCTGLLVDHLASLQIPITFRI